jgi:tRNA dimethylallyltransferase
MLKTVDPQSANTIHPNNRKRVIRALEYFHDTGELISTHNEQQRQNESPYNFAYFVLNDDRNKLYERINKRVDIMIEHGLVEEVQKLLDMGYNRELVSMQGIGYKETVQYIYGEISFDEMIDLIKKNTRHFAKRQLTWFRREKEVIMLDWQDFQYDKQIILKEVLMILQKRNIIKDIEQ